MHNVNENGNKNTLNSIDSVVITKDTIIKGNKFYRYDRYSIEKHYNLLVSSSFLRDSFKNAVNPNGKLYFSEKNFSDTIYRGTRIYNNIDTICWLTAKMEKDASSINLPCGRFLNTLVFKYKVVPYRAMTKVSFGKHNYAKNVGLIMSDDPHLYGGFNEEQLIRYKVNL